MKKAIGKFVLPVVVLGAFLPTVHAADKLTLLDEYRYMIGNGLLQGAFAKELCSCRYVSKLSLNDCLSHVGLPAEIVPMMEIHDEPAHSRVTVLPALNPISIDLISPAMAALDLSNVRKGCRLISGMIEVRKQAGH